MLTFRNYCGGAEISTSHPFPSLFPYITCPCPLSPATGSGKHCKLTQCRVSINPTKRISRRFPGDILTKLYLPRSHWSYLPDAFYLILADNYWAARLIPEISDHVYQVNVTIKEIYVIIITIFQTTGLQLNFLQLDSFVVIASVKNFQEDQLNSSRFAVFPWGIKNSRFAVFPYVVDTVQPHHQTIFGAFWHRIQFFSLA